jgi:hypothetical protein
MLLVIIAEIIPTTKIHSQKASFYNLHSYEKVFNQNSCTFCKNENLKILAIFVCFIDFCFIMQLVSQSLSVNIFVACRPKPTQGNLRTRPICMVFEFLAKIDNYKIKFNTNI